MSLDLRNVWPEIFRNNLRKFRHVCERLQRTSHPRWNFSGNSSRLRQERERERFFVFASRDVTRSMRRDSPMTESRRKGRKMNNSLVKESDNISIPDRFSRHFKIQGLAEKLAKVLEESRLFNPRLISCCTRNIVGRSIHISNPTRSLGPGLVNSI